MRMDIGFGEGLWEIKITSFHYDDFSGLIHIVLQRGGRVEQLQFTASELVHHGVIDVDKIKEFWIKK